MDGLAAVDEFIEEVLGCMNHSVAEQVREMLGILHLGYRESTGRLGVLFPGGAAEALFIVKKK